MVGGPSDTAVEGAVSASTIWAESAVNVSVVSSTKSTPRLPPFMPKEPSSLKLKSSGWFTVRVAWIGIVIEVAVDVTAGCVNEPAPNCTVTPPYVPSRASIAVASAPMLA